MRFGVINEMIYKKFVDAFKNYADCYCIIGGNAATILLNGELYEGSGYQFRKTQDYDVVLNAAKKNTGFSACFLKFIKDNDYEDIVHSVDEETTVHYYRFKTNREDVPRMIETFSRPELKVPLKIDNQKTPVPEGYDPSLSALLLDKDYYEILKEGTIKKDGLTILDVPYLIYFKAKAHLDITNKVKNGERVNHADKQKHFNDICQLTFLITDEMKKRLYEQNIPGTVKNDMKDFISIVQNTSEGIFPKKFKEIPNDLRPTKKEVLSQLQLLI